MKSKATDLERLAGQGYPMRVYRDPDSNEWVAEVSDLPGCIGVGDTREAAVSVAGGFIREWIDEALSQGWDVPEPTPHTEASGRFVLRLPKSLHMRLQTIAADEGTSLNQMAVALLSERVGQRDVFAALKTAFEAFAAAGPSHKSTWHAWHMDELPPGLLAHVEFSTDLFSGAGPFRVAGTFAFPPFAKMSEGPVPTSE